MTAIDIQKSAAWIAAHRLDLRTDAGKQIAGLIADAITAERKHWTDRQEIERANMMAAVDDAAANAFEMGEHAERLRCVELVKAWCDGLKGSEYLARSIEMLMMRIAFPAKPKAETPPQSHKAEVSDRWIKVPEEPTLELLKSINIGNQVLAYQDGRYFNAWFEFEQSEGGWFWRDDADSEPNPSHYRPLGPIALSAASAEGK